MLASLDVSRFNRFAKTAIMFLLIITDNRE